MPSSPPTESIAHRLAEWAKSFDLRLAKLIRPGFGEAGDPPPGRLVSAMRYAVLAPGKRLRPYLVCRCCELGGGSEEAAIPVAAAIECIHAFSLVHDDLPAMDDDDLRRGQPTCHIQFDEATAILAGDALLAWAFQLVAARVKDAEQARGIIGELARATGAAGMIGGQVADIEGEQLPPDAARTEYIHLHKTARLVECACRCGTLLADTDQKTATALSGYGQALGRAFQVVDDLLDVTSSGEVLGKRTGKDAPAGKQTYPRCVGIEASRQTAARLTAMAVSALDVLDSGADDLRNLAGYLLERTR